jgi:hypothetical protein
MTTSRRGNSAAFLIGWFGWNKPDLLNCKSPVNCLLCRDYRSLFAMRLTRLHCATDEG